MKDHVEMWLKERSTSFREGGNSGSGVSGVLVVSEILLDLRIRRFKLGSCVRHAMDEREVMRLSSSVRSVIVWFRVCGVSVE